MIGSPLPPACTHSALVGHALTVVGRAPDPLRPIHEWRLSIAEDPPTPPGGKATLSRARGAILRAIFNRSAIGQQTSNVGMVA